MLKFILDSENNETFKWVRASARTRTPNQQMMVMPACLGRNPGTLGNPRTELIQKLFRRPAY
jgi:hypothetical protein